MPNSFRFAQDIADFADPLAVVPQGLKGLRDTAAPDSADMAGKHTIFLFDDATISAVLSNYAAYLTEIFSEKELKSGTFTAVGAVHRPTGDDNLPRNVGNYWPGYDYELSGIDPRPRTFVQYIRAGSLLSQRSGETHDAVEKIAEGLIRLARIVKSDFRPGNRTRKHRHVLELLDGADDAKAVYLDLQRELAIECAALDETEWNDRWRPAVNAIVKAIAGAEVEGAAADGFLAWSEAPDAGQHTGHPEKTDNIFRYPEENPSVAVRVGSIHSVKGETHTAALVLETFYRSHHLKTLRKWLTGEKSGGRGESEAMQSRLRQHYVAMTRPSHLLCLAMREDALTETEIVKLRERGWRLVRITNDGPS